MAKELPYFKFEPAEYLTKDISFCSLGAQGLFINICSYYWQRGCNLTKDQLLKRLNYETELNELISEGIIDLKDNNIVIKFLDLQLNEVVKTSKQNSINGSKGGRPRKPKQNQKETENKPTALIPLSETKGIREDKIRLDKIKEDNIKIDDESTLIDINFLSTVYLKNERLIKAVISEPKNKVKNKDDLINKIQRFNQHLEQQNRFSESQKEYNIYFLNWLRKQKENKHPTKQKISL